MKPRPIKLENGGGWISYKIMRLRVYDNDDESLFYSAEKIE